MELNALRDVTSRSRGTLPAKWACICHRAGLDIFRRTSFLLVAMPFVTSCFLLLVQELLVASLPLVFTFKENLVASRISKAQPVHSGGEATAMSHRLPPDCVILRVGQDLSLKPPSEKQDGAGQGRTGLERKLLF